MNTHIHVSGLTYFCTDDTLRQAFQPFGTVVLAQVLRDQYGHSLGLGIVHMASSEDVDGSSVRTSALRYRVTVWIFGNPRSGMTPRPVRNTTSPRKTLRQAPPIDSQPYKEATLLISQRSLSFASQLRLAKPLVDKLHWFILIRNC